MTYQSLYVYEFYPPNILLVSLFKLHNNILHTYRKYIKLADSLYKIRKSGFYIHGFWTEDLV